MVPPTLIIVNTDARQGQVLLPQLPTLLKDASIQGSIVPATPQTFLSELENAMSSKPPLLVVAGGDGTVATAINAVKGTSTLLGIIPAGTTNNLARSLNIPLDFPSALKVITHHHVIHLSLGQIHLPNQTSSFATAASIGLSALTIPQTNNAHKRLIGRLAYIIEGLKHFSRHQAFHCHLTVNQRVYSFFTHEIIITNTQHQAGIPLSPEDLKEQSRVAITILATRHSRLLHIWNFLKLLTGHTSAPTLLQKTTNQITIKLDPPQPLEADGEDLGVHSNLTIVADPKKAHIITPPN